MFTFIFIFSSYRFEDNKCLSVFSLSIRRLVVWSVTRSVDYWNTLLKLVLFFPIWLCGLRVVVHNVGLLLVGSSVWQPRHSSGVSRSLSVLLLTMLNGEKENRVVSSWLTRISQIDRHVIFPPGKNVHYSLLECSIALFYILSLLMGLSFDCY